MFKKSMMTACLLGACAVQSAPALLWHNDTQGAVSAYVFSSQTDFTLKNIANLHTSVWQLAASGDVNGDGEQDLLWRHTQTGANYLHLLKQGKNTATLKLNTVADLNWSVVAMADINGDKTDDVIWQNTQTGVVYAYLMQDAKIVAQGLLRQDAQNERVIGAADFDQDGKADLVYRDTVTGQNRVQHLDGLQSRDLQNINRVADVDWKIAAIADFNADGYPDVFWRHAQTGLNVVYMMQDATISSLTVLNKVNSAWHVATAFDLNADHQADIIWRNQQSGDNYVYLMQGPSIASYYALNRVGNLNWQITRGIQINPPENQAPVALISGYESLTPAFGSQVTLSGLDSTDDGKIVSYAWSTGATTPTIDYVFDSAGTHTIELTVTDNQGKTNTTQQVFTVEPEQSKTIKVWIQSATAPTIWAWIDNGTQISQDMKFTWQQQQTLVKDVEHPEYYVWELPEKYVQDVSSATPIKFILNSQGYPHTISQSGCLNNKGQWDNLNEGCFITTTYQPYIGPYLTLISPELSANNQTVQVLDPRNSMVVSYETDSQSDSWSAKVHYRKLGSTEWQEALESSKGARIHHITLRDLQADTTYEYKIFSPQGAEGKVYSFKTAAKEMDYSHFLAIGDMQDPSDDKQRWQDVANTIVANHLDDFDFIMTVGDMAADDMAFNNDRYFYWRVFFNKGQALFARKPMMPTPGNHDTPENTATGDPTYNSNAEDTHSYRKYFNLPIDMAFADYYHFDYGNAHFMSVNSEIPVFYGRHPERDTQNRVSAQYNWLKTELDKATPNTWNFAFWHVPAINPAGGKDEVQFLRPLTDLFGGKLDWAITGHVHEGQRVKPTIADSQNLKQVSEYGRRDNQGVGYLICPPAGQWPRNNSSDQMGQLAYYPNYQGQVTYEIGYVIVKVDGQKIALTTYGMGDVAGRNPTGYADDGSARVMDRIEYSKIPVTLVANAGNDVTVKVGDSVNFDASGSSASQGSITSYVWSNGLTGVKGSKVYDTVGVYSVTLTITDSLGATATDTVQITVKGDEPSFKSSVGFADYRGSSNTWTRSAMSLIADYTWQIDITVAPNDASPAFKFFVDNLWLGDNQPDGVANNNEESNIALSQGAGTYRIMYHDNTHGYTVEKQ